MYGIGVMAAYNNLDALKAQSLHYHQQPADVIKNIKI